MKKIEDIINAYFELQIDYMEIGDDNVLNDIPSLFAEDVNFFIAGNTELVPWIGEKHGHSGVKEFLKKFRLFAQPLEFDIESKIVDGESAVILGDLKTKVKETEKVISSEFAIVFLFSNDLITYFRIFEDTYAVSEAMKS